MAKKKKLTVTLSQFFASHLQQISDLLDGYINSLKILNTDFLTIKT